jgi:hypothetical protein
MTFLCAAARSLPMLRGGAKPAIAFRRRYDNVSMPQILYLMAQPQLKQ